MPGMGVQTIERSRASSGSLASSRNVRRTSRSKRSWKWRRVDAALPWRTELVFFLHVDFHAPERFVFHGWAPFGMWSTL